MPEAQHTKKIDQEQGDAARPITASNSLLRKRGADMRVQIVDQVDTADFAVVDDFAPMPGSPCVSAGRLRTVRVVQKSASRARRQNDADF
jgi:hypothetical protein